MGWDWGYRFGFRKVCLRSMLGIIELKRICFLCEGKGGGRGEMTLVPVRMLVQIAKLRTAYVRPLRHRDVISIGRLMINDDDDCLLVHHDP